LHLRDGEQAIHFSASQGAEQAGFSAQDGTEDAEDVAEQETSQIFGAEQAMSGIFGAERICSSSAFFMCLCDCCVLVFLCFWESIN